LRMSQLEMHISWESPRVFLNFGQSREQGYALELDLQEWKQRGRRKKLSAETIPYARVVLNSQ
jgi:hypothetical protein